MHKNTKAWFYSVSIFVIVAIAFFGVISSYFFQKKGIEEMAHHNISKYFEGLDHYIQEETNTIKTFIEIVQQNKKIEKSFSFSNQKELFSQTKPFYDMLHKNNEITHFYFINTEGEIVLRVHNRSFYGDRVKRETFLQSKQTKELFSGIEFGVKKNYTLRVVSPWIVDGELLGYIEIGKEIDKIIKTLSKRFKIQIHFAVDKDQYRDASQDLQKKIKGFLEIDNYYFAYQSDYLNSKILSRLLQKEDNHWERINNKEYISYKRPLKDVSEKDLGEIIFLVDVNKAYKILLSSVFNNLSFMVFSTFLIVFIGYFFAQKKKNILNEINQNLQRFIDTQDNIVILTDGVELTFANKRFFDFLGYKNLAHFKIDHGCICEYFIENERFFHLGKIKENENWVAVMQKLPHSQRVVSMLGVDFKIHAFSVTINRFDKSTLIVSFTNISQTILEQIKLEEKTIHDKLTGAYNREYFEQIYHQKIFESLKEKCKLGIALLDIDYFKKVNDTYGHDIGDTVLIQFVKTIQRFSRSSDILVRWGGEEFVMVLKVKSTSDLSKALEHIRVVIQNEEFDVVGHKTCSIGATIYKEDEEIQSAIKRADEAVYHAKANGRNQVVIIE